MTQPVSQYRLYFVDRGQHIGKALDIEAPSDDEARAIAAATLAEQSHYVGIEVWQRSRRVCNIELPASPEKKQQAASTPADKPRSDGEPATVWVADFRAKASQSGSGG